MDLVYRIEEYAQPASGDTSGNDASVLMELAFLNNTREEALLLSAIFANAPRKPF